VGERKKRGPTTRLSAEKRERFLEVLGQTGNRRAAAEAIGVEPRLMDQRRAFDPVFDRQWDVAVEQAHRRLAGAAGPLDVAGGGGVNVIRMGAHGRLQTVKAGPKRWSAAVEERFLAALGVCGNMAAAARAVGFTASCVWQRRRKYSNFAERIDEMLEEAEVALELRLAFMGNDAPGRGDAEGAGALAAMLPEAGHRFDPDLALRFLRWRAEKKRTGKAPSRGGRPERAMPLDDVVKELGKRIKAFGAREDAAKLKEGWSQDANGWLIPPGWVRAEGGGEGAPGPEEAEGLGVRRRGR